MTRFGRPIEPPQGGDNIIAELRRKTGWSQAETAKRMGCTRQAVSLWELGDREIPETIRILVGYLVRDLGV